MNILRKSLSIGLLIMLMFLLLPIQPNNAASSSVPDTRFARLTRGVNMMWMRDVPSYENMYGPQDIALIKAAGFRHIRLSVNVANLFNENAPTQLNQVELAKLNHILDMIIPQGLGVIVELHDADARLFNGDAAYTAKFATFWETLARALSSRDPEYLFLEVLNEPQSPEASMWNATLDTLVAAIRRGAPRHTIIADINERSTNNVHDVITAVELTHPVSDPNVVYNFHFYTPFVFTFQGVFWMGPEFQSMHNLPYPATLDLCKDALPAIDNPTGRSWAEGYCYEGMNATKIEGDFQRVAAWSQKYGVRVTMNEFGVWKPASPNDSRLRWLKDVRTFAEKYNIGWAIWDYSPEFGVVNINNGVKSIATDTLAALGLGAQGQVNDNLPLPNTVPQPTPAPQPTQSTKTIYNYSLAQGWENWSWDSNVDPNANNPTERNLHALSVASIKPWNGLYLHNPYGGDSTDGATALEFYIHGGDTGNQQLWVYAQDSSSQAFLPKLLLNKYIPGGKVVAGEWRDVIIPLADLGLGSRPLTGFVLQDLTGTTQPSYYVDNIRLLSPSNTNNDGAGPNFQLLPVITLGKPDSW